ncbi:hypothetical protein AB0L65_33285 [Nonomuraea sp. NPDC052116]|uniref:hypothetical protein n=1 Tax=Nonomuraea sp. NPDC052116 TaxID=3155665 RepID=UPI003420ED20
MTRPLRAVPNPLEEPEDDVMLDSEADQVAQGELVEVEQRLPAVLERREPARAVNGVEVNTPWSYAFQGRAIFPAWLVQREQRRAAIKWARDLVIHEAAFHAVRLPLYGLRLCMYTPRGVGRSVAAWGRWVSDSEGRPMRRASIVDGDTGRYSELVAQRNARVRTRSIVTVGSLGLSGILLLIVAIVWPWLMPWLAAGAIATFGRVGRRKDKPIVEHARIANPKARRLTEDVLTRAFIAAGLCTQEDPIGLLQPIQRDGAGWLAFVELPYGKNAEAAVKKKLDIAGGLGVHEVQVFMDRLPGMSPRHLRVWVADVDPYASMPPVTPLLAMERLDFWKGFPFGVDARGQVIYLSLIWSSLLVGAIPRMGKTFAARLPALAAALDPFVTLIVFDGKGGKDWKAFEQVAYRYGSGVRTVIVELLLETLRELKAEMDRRYEVLQDLPDDICPEGKITPALSRNPTMNMQPILVCIDEFQRYLENGTFGEAIKEVIDDIVKTGPAVGIMFDVATQKPDGKTIPTKIRDNIGTRFALKVMTFQSSEVILGAGTRDAGLDASKFQRSHKGVGILLGADDGELADAGGQTVRTHLADLRTVSTICERGRDLRIAAGTLAGHAAGEQIEERVTISVLNDVAGVFARGEDRLWSEEICERLAEVNPDAYSGWDATTLAKMLKPYGLKTADVWIKDPEDGGSPTRKGLKYEWVLAAQGGRTGKGGR